MRAVAIAIIGFLIAGMAVTTASATPTKESVAPLCVPHDAVPYQPAVYETVHHDAVPETFTTVHHDAVTHTQWKYEQHGGPGMIWVDNHTFKYVDENGVGYNHKDDIPEHTKYYERTEHTQQATDTAAWDEQVGNGDGVAAYDEQVLVTPEVLAVDAVTCPDPEPQIVTEWYTWDTGAWTPDATGASTTHWPQSLVGAGQIAPTDCEKTYQQDKYVGTQAAIDAVLADGMLTNIGHPEDYLLVKQWKFVSTGACPVVQEVTPTAPTVVPMCGPNNDTVTIPTTEGVDYTDTGWIHGDRTITATAQEGYKLVGTTSWKFHDANRDCPVTATAPTVVPLCGPNNDTVTIPTTEGVRYLDSGWYKGERVIIAVAKDGYKLSGNWYWKFHDANTACQVEVTAVEATVVDPPVCGPNNDLLNIPTTEGVTYSDTGWVNGERTITATANEGYVLVGQDSWTFYDAATTCPNENTGGEVTAEPPTVVPVCMPNNDTVTIPEVQGVSYSDTGWVDGKRTITATPLEGYSLIGDTSWTFTDVPSAGCTDPGPVFSGEDPSLAFTGAPSNTGGLAAWAIALISGGMVLVVRRRRAI